MSKLPFFYLVPGCLTALRDLSARGRGGVGARFGAMALVKQDSGQRGGDDASNVAEHVACATAKQTPHRAKQVRSQHPVQPKKRGKGGKDGARRRAPRGSS